MLTTVPYNDFLNLCDSIHETTQNEVFDWNEMLRHSYNLNELYNYISTTNCKLVGKGSARAAFFLPSKSHIKEKIINEPSCFKVAIEPKRGQAQNEAEIKILNKHKNNNKYSIFPRLFEWDRDNFYFLLCEVGTPIKTMNEQKKYEFFNPIASYVEKNYPSLYKNQYWKIKDGFRFCGMLGTIGAFYNYDEKTKETALTYIKILKEIANKYSRFKSITNFLDYMIDTFNGKENDSISLGDFVREDNWAIVKRDGEEILIPIDWGFTHEVSSKYY